MKNSCVEPDFEFSRHTDLDPLRWSRRELVRVARIRPLEPFSSMIDLFAPPPDPSLSPLCCFRLQPQPRRQWRRDAFSPPYRICFPHGRCLRTPFEARPGLPQSKGTATRVGVVSVLLSQLLWLFSRGRGGSNMDWGGGGGVGWERG